MSLDEDSKIKRRKLNLLDFIKDNDASKELPRELPKEPAEAESVEAPPAAPKRTSFKPLVFNKVQFDQNGSGNSWNQDDEDEDVEDEDYDDQDYDDQDDRPSFANFHTNFVGFTANKPVSFTKAQSKDIEEQEGSNDETETPDVPNKQTLSYSELESIDNTVRVQKNAFKGKKYGIGAALLKKMGYVEGQGLGKDGQGIIEPIKQDVRKMGVGIGGGNINDKSKERKNNKDQISSLVDDADSDSSDEEFYRDIPKKSLFQIITEIESLGVEIPSKIKEISNDNLTDSNKTFIALKKEGNKQLEDLTTQLDQLNTQLQDAMSDRKLNQLSRDEYLKRLVTIDDQISQFESNIPLLERFNKFINTISEFPFLEQSKLLRNEFTKSTLQLQNASILFDWEKISLITIKPIIIGLFNDWNPLNLDDTKTLDELLEWRKLLPESVPPYGELNYFQSLICSLWYPKISQIFTNRSVDQPNVALTILSDWDQLLDDSILKVFINNIILHEIVENIRNWVPNSPIENPPYVYIFEWLPILNTNLEEITQEFTLKYKQWFETWKFGVKIIDGLYSFREIVGLDKFNQLIMKSLLPKLVSFYVNLELSFEDPSINVDYFKSLIEWVDFVNPEVFNKVLKYGFLNSWLRSLYSSLGSPNKKYSFVAQALAKWFDEFEPFLTQFDIIQEYYILALDMINKYIDTGSLSKYHQSLTTKSATELIFSNLDQPTDEKSEVKGIPIHKLQITFKEVLEEYCTKNNLFLTSLKSDLSSGHLLFKISKDHTGKRGLVGYISHDVLWLKQNDDEFKPISLDSLASLIH